MKGINGVIFTTCGLLLAGLVMDGTLSTQLVSQKAEAIIGLPFTPLSYAGVARRTTRRMIYATSIYAATLPVGCTSVVINGTSLYQCGATYYQPSGNQYVVVNVQ
ncbi:MAG TPA: hypothetical protein IGR64_15400 [Leptolyngbyaceae cyanobacterium M65_K2018_010]|nr:hypothetical protein [Leptolyngbyaceae cyanobacterium M65_K2018_010]